MPPCVSKISQYAAKVAELREHITHLCQYTKPNIKSYATVHALPYQRLLRLYNDSATRSNHKPLNYHLSKEQDLALKRYLDAIDAIGYGIHRGLVITQAYALMEESYIGPDEASPPLGKNWGRRWLQRHPKYRRVKVSDVRYYLA
jgi:hypothetical protein